MDLLTVIGCSLINMIAILFGFVMGFVSKHNDGE